MGNNALLDRFGDVSYRGALNVCRTGCVFSGLQHAETDELDESITPAEAGRQPVIHSDMLFVCFMGLLRS